MDGNRAGPMPNGVGMALYTAGDADADVAGLKLADRPATALANDPTSPFTAAFSLRQLYFAEQPPADRLVLRRGIDVRTAATARVLLRAADADWSLFNDPPEAAKCGAAILYERLAKPPGAALVGTTPGVLACSLDYRVATPAADAMWRQLFAGLALRLNAGRPSAASAFDDHRILATADVDGRPAHYADYDRFVFDHAGRVTIRFWVKSPRALDDVLAGGPDVPKLDLVCYAADSAELSLNGRTVLPTRSGPADYRTLSEYAAVPLRRGWNAVLIRVMADHVNQARPPTLAVHARSSDAAFMAAVESLAEPPPGGE